MKVSDLHPGAVAWAAPSETLKVAAKYLVDDDVGALVVLDSHGAVGVLSERDIVRAVADGEELDTVRVEDFMTDAPIEIDVTAPLSEAVAKLNEYGVRHLVVQDGKETIGMISMRDVFRLQAALSRDL